MWKQIVRYQFLKANVKGHKSHLDFRVENIIGTYLKKCPNAHNKGHSTPKKISLKPHVQALHPPILPPGQPCPTCTHLLITP